MSSIRKSLSLYFIILAIIALILPLNLYAQPSYMGGSLVGRVGDWNTDIHDWSSESWAIPTVDNAWGKIYDVIDSTMPYWSVNNIGWSKYTFPQISFNASVTDTWLYSLSKPTFSYQGLEYDNQHFTSNNWGNTHSISWANTVNYSNISQPTLQNNMSILSSSNLPGVGPWGFNSTYPQQYQYPTYQQQNQYVDQTTQYTDTDVDLYYDDDGKTITVDKGDTIGIILSSDHSTGHRWFDTFDDQGNSITDYTVVLKISDEFFASQAGGGIYSDGTVQWIFKAEDVGTSIIRLEYHQLIGVGTQISLPPFDTSGTLGGAIFKDTFEVEIVVK